MEETWRGRPKRWRPVGSESVWASRFGMDWWLKEQSGLNRKQKKNNEVCFSRMFKTDVSFDKLIGR